MYEFKNEEGVICYLKNVIDTKFDLQGIAFEYDPNKVYLINYTTSDPNDYSKTTEYCCIDSLLDEKFIQIINSQLQIYVKAHIGRYDMYKFLDKDGINRFYQKNVYRLADRIEKPYFSYRYKELAKGIVSIRVNGVDLKYDLRTNRINSDIPLFYTVYNSDLDLIVAKEQLRLGIAPLALTELYNFEMALGGKKNIKLVFKDGETVTKRLNNFSKIDQVFNFTFNDNNISCWLSYSGFGYKNIDHLDYIKIGRDKYYFNFENLNELCRPKQEIGA